ncbi:molybdopterin-guanine dinucleotide biosynthesis protein A [Oikeobacillus pervagus]|uniref:Probable molybdenum cofactor guanylyltransferase n=1 Tax=Oikeobacillus pervagus TaxID=1325931 RepID=A0AAJ1WJC2_9BACI|nr:molybdenum cofactor guanylyltransferase [Oikeobacillus pervagus]MDQ0215313.1 molybdopterin-guanine dinucleotide biosynthesis protein A [Oikeobacillus pervagus]
MNASVFILAGGQSRRMGRNKALLPLGNETVMERLISEFRPTALEIALLINENGYTEWDVTQFKDEPPYQGCGPLAGIYTALKHTTSDYNLFIACDMPFVTREVGEWMIKQLHNSQADAIIPYEDEKPHPLFATYHRRCIDQVKAQLEDGNFRIKSFLEKIKIMRFDRCDLPFCLQQNFEQIFWNMNDKEAYEKAKEMMNRS